MYQAYFPSTILSLYVADSQSEFETLLGRPIEIYIRFKKTNDVDKRTAIYLPGIYKDIYFLIRNGIRKLVLGRDISLFYQIEAPISFSIDDEDIEYALEQLVKADESLRIRRAFIASRILLTDVIARYLVEAYKDLYDLVSEIEKLKKELMPYATPEVSSLYSTLPARLSIKDENKSHAVVFASNYSRITVTVPEPLFGFVSYTFPMMSFARIAHDAFLHFLISDAYTQLGEVISKLPSFKQKTINRIESYLERSLSWYKTKLIEYLDELRKLYTGVQDDDAIESFILRSIPASLLDLYNLSVKENYNFDTVLSYVTRLIRVGKVYVDGDIIRYNGNGNGGGVNG